MTKLRTYCVQSLWAGDNIKSWARKARVLKSSYTHWLVQIKDSGGGTDQLRVRLLERFRKASAGMGFGGWKGGQRALWLCWKQGQWEEGRGLRGLHTGGMGCKGFITPEMFCEVLHVSVCVFWEPPRAFIRLSGDQSVAQKH